jgi:protein-arginine kinase activator protein McsA
MAVTKLCEICKERPARLLLLRRRFDENYRTFVCLECGEERARLYADAPLDFRQFGVSAADPPDWMPESSLCPLCGSDLSNAGADLRPGCCECYARFADVLTAAVRAVQGHTRHLGKSPR